MEQPFWERVGQPLKNLRNGGGRGVQQVKPPAATPASHIRDQVPAPTALLPTQQPANVLGKGAGDGPSTCIPVTYVGDLGGVLSCWLWPGPDPGVADIWG